MNINVDMFMNSLPYMGKGLLGIFVVIGIMILTIVMLNKVTSDKKQ